MTARQFAVASAADIKWIMNSAALLRRRLRYSDSEARWWGFVRLLTEAIELPLQDGRGHRHGIVSGRAIEHAGDNRRGSIEVRFYCGRPGPI